MRYKIIAEVRPHDLNQVVNIDQGMRIEFNRRAKLATFPKEIIQLQTIGTDIEIELEIDKDKIDGRDLRTFSLLLIENYPFLANKKRILHFKEINRI